MKQQIIDILWDVAGHEPINDSEIELYADQILDLVLNALTIDVEKLIETGVPNKGDTTGSDIKYGWNSAIDAVLEEIKNKLRS